MTTKINDYLNRIGIYDELKVGLIVPSSQTIRKSPNNLDELMDSIRANGLLEPLIVRPHRGKFELVAGHRRFEACKRLRFKKIGCIVAELDDKQSFEFSLIENLQRETLEPLEEALAFKNYCDKFGWGSQTELAKKIGKSQEFVSHRLRLLALPDEIKELLSAKKVSLTEAKRLSWMKDPEISLQDQSSEVFDDDFPSRVSNHSPIDPMSYEEERLVSDSILIVRIALVRIDNLIAKAKSAAAREFLIGKRKQLHTLLDESITFRSILGGEEITSPMVMKQ